MAAVTVTAGTRRDGIMGNMRTVTEAFAAVSDADTWTPGLAIIENVIIEIQDAAAPAAVVGATWTTPAGRQAVVTIGVETGTPDLRCTAFGY
ncbi:MAG: hypothetical protein U1B30_06795 [Pseudomonadota bacterium]|nr:hypothetical protein [Pseudomonadota bacterium]